MLSPKLQPDFPAETRIIAKIIADRQDERSISPSWVATEAMVKLRAKSMMQGSGNRRSVYRLAHEQCKQIARRLLRKFYEPEDDAEKDQHELFKNLQGRYPVAPKPGRDEPEYVRLEHLSASDWRFNVDRLRADAESRLQHADALEGWGLGHFRNAA